MAASACFAPTLSSPPHVGARPAAPPGRALLRRSARAAAVAALGFALGVGLALGRPDGIGARRLAVREPVPPQLRTVSPPPRRTIPRFWRPPGSTAALPQLRLEPRLYNPHPHSRDVPFAVFAEAGS